MKSSHRLHIRGGHVICPVSGLNEKADILIENGRIARIGKNPGKIADCEVFDARGLTVMPGLIDMHVHLREPGREDEETIESGCRAAQAGGFTAVCPMANTEPQTDDASRIRAIINRAQGAPARVYPYGSITKSLRGEELSEMGDMVMAGAVRFADDGYGIQNAWLMDYALRDSAMFGKPIVVHEEDISLSANGQMNEGNVSTILGFVGIPSLSEELPITRDIEILRWIGDIGARLHITHISTRGAVELVKKAKNDGLPVTCDVTPHHFSLTDEGLVTFDTMLKMKPPLRTSEDVKAIKMGLKEGIIDAIATDHAPHSLEEKEVEFIEAAFGITQLETALALAIDVLAGEGVLDLQQIVKKMSTAPAAILGLEGGSLKEGEIADLCILDPNEKWELTPENTHSKSINSPFMNRSFTGRVRATVLGGELQLNE